MRRLASTFTLLLLLCSALILLSETGTVRASETIYIRADGSVEGTSAIQRIGDVYTFTANIYDSIVVERDNIVVDGGGYTLQGTGSGNGIELSGIRKNVTVKNFNIKYFHTGIYIGGPYTGAWGEEGGNTISGNNVTNNKYGIWLKDSPDNVFRNNVMADNEYNIVFEPTVTTFYYRQDIDASNTVNGKPIYYWVNEQNKTVPFNAGYVALIGCRRITVKNLALSNNRKGILLVYTTESTITNNTLTNNGVGIHLSESSSNNTIFGNNVINNGYGILIVVSHFNTLRNNRMIDNQQNLVVYGGYLEGFTQHIDTTNTVNGKPVYYWVEEKDKTVPLDAGYVALIKCTNIRVQNLNLTDKGQGIILASTTNSTITQNTIKNKDVGIYLWDSSNNVISENLVANNEMGIRISGVWPYPPNNNEIYRNSIRNNGIGVRIDFSPSNKIYENNIANNGNGIYIEWGGASNNSINHNNFINNTAEAPGTWHVVVFHEVWMPPPANVWDDGKEGNYWSDYITRYPNATEIDGSGIWNTPYVISENNQDNYPLMNPVAIPEFPDEENPIVSPTEPPPDDSTDQTNLDPTPILIAVPIVLAIILGVAVYRRKRLTSSKTP